VTSPLSFDPPQMSVSYPTQIAMHMIYDTELEMLRAAGKDKSFEWSLALGGAGIGLSQNLLKAALLVKSGSAIDALDFVGAALCLICLSAAAVFYRNSQGVSAKIDTLVQEIRDRPKKGGQSTLEEALR
jgi:hypothetical protein